MTNLLRWLVATIALLVSACGGGGGNGGSDTPTPPPDFEASSYQCSQVPGDDANFVNFESGHVKPLALSPDGSRLLVLNTPNNCLEVYATENDQLELMAAVSVGLEPVAVAFRSNTEAWVVNHLSDSVSIVALDEQPRVVQTLLVGDEPFDVVFAGAEFDRAFISAARRGQNHPQFQPVELREPGLGQAELWVFEAGQTGKNLGGNPLVIINLFAAPVRSLVASADGLSVYAATFLSGNRSTTVSRAKVLNAAPLSKPLPDQNLAGIKAPRTALIVQQQGNQWLDDEGQDWTDEIELSLPDNDVFVIDADSPMPSVSASVSGVGTVLFNMVLNPVTRSLYVSNTEALNRVRFEGPGDTASTVRGHFIENRITVVKPDSVNPVHLNESIDFHLEEGEGIPAEEKARALAQPQQMVLSPDGSTLYLAAFGSNKVAVIDTAQLEAGNYVDQQVVIDDGAPAGLALNEAGDRLYVYSRYGHSVQLYDTTTGAMLRRVEIFNPEPAKISEGRRFLYDAELSSATGTTSCGGCHIFGNLDALAWDLGNPDEQLQEKPINIVDPPSVVEPSQRLFHPMKGPMTTQTFRGINDSGPMHWRGDRTGNDPAIVDGVRESREAAAFKAFNPAFVGLVGRQQELTTQQLQQLTDFSLSIVPPPNPVRQLDNSLTASQERGRDIYFNERRTASILFCNDCHLLDPAQKLFGTNTTITFEGPFVDENFKVPQLRNMYQKVGFFHSPGKDPVVTGFGFVHDGAVTTMHEFFTEAAVFTFPNDGEIDDVTDFLFAFDSNLAPVVGQQVTLTASAPAAVNNRIRLFEERAALAAPECDLVVRGLIDGQHQGALFQGSASYLLASGDTLSISELRSGASAEGGELTFTCVAPGTGQRLAN